MAIINTTIDTVFQEALLAAQKKDIIIPSFHKETLQSHKVLATWNEAVLKTSPAYLCKLVVVFYCFTELFVLAIAELMMADTQRLCGTPDSLD